MGQVAREAIRARTQARHDAARAMLKALKAMGSPTARTWNVTA